MWHNLVNTLAPFPSYCCKIWIRNSKEFFNCSSVKEVKLPWNLTVFIWIICLSISPIVQRLTSITEHKFLLLCLEYPLHYRTKYWYYIHILKPDQIIGYFRTKIKKKAEKPSNGLLLKFCNRYFNNILQTVKPLSHAKFNNTSTKISTI